MTDQPVNQLKKALFAWSGGKDSAYALHKIRQEGGFEIVGLLTTLHGVYHRVSMHGVREELLEKQAEAAGLPLIKMFVYEGTNGEYEKNMEKLLHEYKARGVNHVIFGDIFLEDLRAYRESNLAKAGMTAVFPLWKMDTAALVRDFIASGFRTITCCVNDASLDERFAGVEIDADFIRRLPAEVDPCGENGEFHTFCFDGPVFSSALRFTTGEKVYRPMEMKATGETATKGFWFVDLLPWLSGEQQLHRGIV